MIVLGPVFLVQFIIFVIIIVILKKVLDNMLVESAIKKFAFSEFVIKSDNPPQVIFISHKPPKASLKEIFIKLAQKRLGQNAEAVFQTEKKIWGGVIIKYDDLVVDCSLVTRLKQGGFLR